MDIADALRHLEIAHEIATFLTETMQKMEFDVSEIYFKALKGGLEELLRAGVDINTQLSSRRCHEVTPAAPSRVADR